MGVVSGRLYTDFEGGILVLIYLCLDMELIVIKDLVPENSAAWFRNHLPGEALSNKVS
jgi:hypothetical protein